MFQKKESKEMPFQGFLNYAINKSKSNKEKILLYYITSMSAFEPIKQISSCLLRRDKEESWSKNMLPIYI
jgi:hypothetical protein